MKILRLQRYTWRLATGERQPKTQITYKQDDGQVRIHMADGHLSPKEAKYELERVRLG